MSARRKHRLGLVVIVALALALAAAGVAASLSLASGGMDAIDQTDWQKVAGYLDSYIDSQYNANDDGEAGFLVTAAELKNRIDSNGDNTFLGEGDDAANAPILVDVLNTWSTWLPATSLRVAWNSDAASQVNIDKIKTKVANHEAAGFSTDIIDYCLTGHTESVVTGAYGAIAQAGGFGSTPPKVYDLKWGRYGWNSGAHSYTNTKSIVGDTLAGSTHTAATNGVDCSGETTDAGMTRCVAADALAKVGAGTTPWDAASDGNYQPVDIRSATIDNSNKTMANQTSGSAYVTQVPLPDLFDATAAGYQYIDPAGQKVFVTNRTQHTAGIAAVGLTMLGYDTTFAKWGLPEWNNTIGEQFTGGAGYPVGTYAIDETAPTITNGPTVTPTNDGAVITWTTDEPATTMLEWSTSQGGPYNKVNDTVLHANHTATLTGQAAGTTIYYRVSSYDGQANGVTTSEGSFTTLRQVNHTTDMVYYMPWYDSATIAGWQGDWLVIDHIAGAGGVDVEVRINGAQKATNTLQAGESWTPSFADVTDGMVEVICWDCKSSSDVLAVSQRTLFKDTFNETLALEWSDLGSSWAFPWYDNNAAGGMMGDWILIANPDSSDATVDITVGGSAVAESPVTVAAGSVEAVRVAASTTSGPVKVTAQGSQMLMVTQRVIFRNSFNEVNGMMTS